MDFSTLKRLTIPEGAVTKIVATLNNAVTSYQNGYRFSASGALKEQEGSVATGYIPCESGSVVYMKNAEWGRSGENYVGMYTYVVFYNDSKEFVTVINGDMETLGTLPNGITISTDNNDVTIFDFTEYSKEFSYISISAKGYGESVVVTVNDYPIDMVLWEVYHNLVPTAIDKDGSIFNGTGYKEGYRLNSSGGETVNSSAVYTGYIASTKGDIVRYTAGRSQNIGGTYIAFYKSDFSLIGINSVQTLISSFGAIEEVLPNGDYLVTFDTTVLSASYNDTAYIRVSGHHEGRQMIVTLNEEIAI